MKTEKKRSQVFLVLVPHRDVRLVLRNYSMTSLPKAGKQGIYDFPWVAPLAVLSRPLNIEELKLCAGAVRKASLTAGGKINGAESSTAEFPACENGALFGPRLDLAISQGDLGGAESGIFQKAVGFFSPPVIGCCLLTSANSENIPPAPQISFRAAAVANMFWRPLSAGGYKWKIEPLCWLPSIKNKVK